MGMLRNHGELADVAHVHCAPTASEVIFADELRAYAGDARLALTLNLDDEHGVLDLDRLDALVPDWRERETWLCGPTGLLDAAEAHWDAAGVADRLHTERFRPTVVEPGEVAPSPSSGATARSRPTAARPSSMPARTPASSCRAAAGWASASAAS